MFDDYIQVKAPLPGAWITHSQNGKAAAQGLKVFSLYYPNTRSGTQSSFSSMGTVCWGYSLE
jgi:hypothetical protein